MGEPGIVTPSSSSRTTCSRPAAFDQTAFFLHGEVVEMDDTEQISCQTARQAHRGLLSPVGFG